MLFGGPETGATTPPDQQLGRAQALASAAGQVLGAISMCDGIESPRIFAAADKIEEILESSVAGDKELRTAKTLFRNGVAEGGHSVSIGKQDCGAAETDFLAMERSINARH